MLVVTNSTFLQLQLDVNAATTPLGYHAAWADVPSVSSAPSWNADTIMAAGTIDLVGGAPGISRLVRQVGVLNQDTIPHTVSILFTGFLLTPLARFALAPGEALYYDDQHGWYSLDGSGAVKLAGAGGGGSPTGAAGGDLAGTYPNPTVKPSVLLTGQPQLDCWWGAWHADSFANPLPLDLNTANKHYTVLTANTVLTFSNGHDGQGVVVGLEQGGTGTNTVTWPGTVKWAGGVAPALSTAVGAVDLISFIRRPGPIYLGMSVLNFH